MEDFGVRPIPFPDAVKEALLAADVSIYAAQGAKGELQTFRQPMLHAIEANPRLRHAHMIGITPQIMTDGMCSDYTEIQRISKLVYEKVKNARTIRVVTDKGNDFTAEFSPDLKWIVSDGDIRPKHWSNLPDGEVFTCPATLNGQVVIDGCLGDFFTEKYGVARRDADPRAGEGRPGGSRRPSSARTRSSARNMRSTSSRATRTATAWASSRSGPTRG